MDRLHGSKIRYQCYYKEKNVSHDTSLEFTDSNARKKMVALEKRKDLKWLDRLEK
jgi:hypothetical protein